MKDTCGLCSILESGEVSTSSNKRSQQFLDTAVDSMVESVVMGSPSKLESIAEGIKEENDESYSVSMQGDEEKKDDDEIKEGEEQRDAAKAPLKVDTTAPAEVSSPTTPLVFDSPKAAAEYRAAKAAKAASSGPVSEITVTSAPETKSTQPPTVVVVEPTLERDFDQNPTDLYLALMRKDWSAAIRRCAERPEEAKTWIYRKETTGVLRWKLLPIHASIIFNAPVPVVDSLLHAYGEGAVCKDDQGMVPLHLAIRMNSDQAVVEKLVAAQPEAVSVTDRKGRTPQALAEKQAACPKTLLVIQTLENASSTASAVPKSIPKQQAQPVVPAPPAPASPTNKNNNKQPGVAYASPKAATEAKKVAAAVAAATAAASTSTTTSGAAVPTAELEKVKTTYAEELEKQSRQALEKEQELMARVEALEAEATSNKATIASLEESLSTFDFREAELKSKIADLESSVAETIKEKTFSEDSNKAVITNLVSQIGDLQSKLTAMTTARDSAMTSHANFEEASKQEMAKMKLKHLEVERQLCQVTFLRDEKTEALLKAEKFIVQQKGQIALMQEDLTSLREKLETTQTKLEEVTISEQELAWRNNALTMQMNGGTGSTDRAGASPSKKHMDASTSDRIKALEREREDLRDTVNKLSVKLYKVVGFLDEMVQEQEAIITETMTRDSEFIVGTTPSSENSNQHQSEDRTKLLSNVAGMKEQIIGVIDSVIEGMPHNEVEDAEAAMEEDTKAPAAILQ